MAYRGYSLPTYLRTFVLSHEQDMRRAHAWTCWLRHRAEKRIARRPIARALMALALRLRRSRSDHSCRLAGEACGLELPQESPHALLRGAARSRAHPFVV